MVALRVALVICWIAAQVVGGILAVLASRDGALTSGFAVPLDFALLGGPALLGGGGLWLAARLARTSGPRAEALALVVPLAALMLATVLVLRTLG